MDRERSSRADAGSAGDSRHRHATLHRAVASLTATAGCPHLDSTAEGENV
jgi:hypothetical protein